MRRLHDYSRKEKVAVAALLGGLGEMIKGERMLHVTLHIKQTLITLSEHCRSFVSVAKRNILVNHLCGFLRNDSLILPIMQNLTQCLQMSTHVSELALMSKPSVG